jgi:putative restriction endonuclease
MAEARKWTRNELLIALNLYEKLRFGQFHERQPVIIEVASRMGRTPASLAMKLGNLASLDPKLKARGIVGLQGASNLDKQVWEEFHENPDALVPASEEAMRQLFQATEQDEVEIVADRGVAVQPALSPPEGPTSFTAEVKVRRGQQYFRQVVLNAFDGRCGITGIAVRELLVASHILTWAEHPVARLDAQNGISLSRLHDGAFDRGLISFDQNYRLVLSKRLRDYLPQAALDANFSSYEGKALSMAPDTPFPNQEYLSVHRKTWDFR